MPSSKGKEKVSYPDAPGGSGISWSSGAIEQFMDSTGDKAITFSYNQLANATHHFSPCCLIDEGFLWKEYGAVSVSGEVFAVKMLKNSLLRLNDIEFLEQVHKLSSLRHPNIVKLIGYCIDRNKHFIVSEFVRWKTLAFRLYDFGPEMRPLDWTSRMRIALGAATGLNFLHNNDLQRIIYNELSSSTVLVGNNLEIKLREAWIPPTFYSPFASRWGHIPGYRAPEVFLKPTTETDVHRFGVLLLELITGRKPIDYARGHAAEQYSLVRWVRHMISEGRLDSVRDPVMEGTEATLGKAVNLAMWCIEVDPQSRPPRMTDVVESLKAIVSELVPD